MMTDFLLLLKYTYIFLNIYFLLILKLYCIINIKCRFGQKNHFNRHIKMNSKDKHEVCKFLCAIFIDCNEQIIDPLQF